MVESYCTPDLFVSRCNKQCLSACIAILCESHAHLRYRAENARQWLSAVMSPKQSKGTVTHPLYVTFKVEATAVALHGGQKRDLIPLLTSLGAKHISLCFTI